ncbi:hypothetical protein FNV43_RR23752 [Rhamnella rubrinervis]|uniref:Uncharacterized protein n=1 Tax=Rhamnella rubrinervis TaxID=2594499 RepID=A0A8K0DKG6_9ROSA|nr:hypothetical protein FNV43_RR23752 [Rhamnella rubrinervis]
MASSLPTRPLLLALSILLVLLIQTHVAMGKGKRARSVAGATALTYHGGPMLTGTINLSVLFYGQIGRVQKNAIRSFLKSLTSTKVSQQPSASAWWSVVESYQAAAARGGKGRSPKIQLNVASVISDSTYSAGKVMTMDFVKLLVDKATAGKPNTLALIFTDRQVTVQDLCTGKCAQHGAFGKQVFVLVGNPETECPDACAWPFVKSNGGPQGVILQPPSGNLGADAMVMSLASGLADAVTNPYNTGFYQAGPRHAGFVGAGTVCKGMFGSGAFPGYTGKVRVDPKTGGAFNIHGVKGTKFLLPALWNPVTSACWTPM